MSPEGAAGSPGEPAAEVYAIDTILCQAIAGRTPFEEGSAVEILARQIDQAPLPIRSIERASYLPEPLASLIMKNLAKRPHDRSPDARALGQALAAATRASGLFPEDLV